MGRFIRLSSPETCDKCGKVIRHDRVAYWSGPGRFTCYTCIKKARGEAPESPEEKLFLAEFESE